MKFIKELRLPLALVGSCIIGAGLAACSNPSSPVRPTPSATPAQVTLNTDVPTGALTTPAAATQTHMPEATSTPALVGPAPPIDPAQALWGRWIGAGTCPFNGAQMTVDMAFSPNHSYSQTTMCAGINGPSTYRILITGDYEVLSASGQIHFTNMRSDPQKLANGYPAIASDSETDSYLLADNGHSLTLSNPLCPACTVTYHR